MRSLYSVAALAWLAVMSPIGVDGAYATEVSWDVNKTLNTRLGPGVLVRFELQNCDTGPPLNAGPGDPPQRSPAFPVDNKGRIKAHVASNREIRCGVPPRTTYYKVIVEENGKVLYERFWFIHGRNLSLEKAMPLDSDPVLTLMIRQPVLEVRSPVGPLALEITDAELNQIGSAVLNASLVGRLRNLTAYRFEMIHLELIFRDENGFPLRVCDTLTNPSKRCLIKLIDAVDPHGGSAQLDSINSRFYPLSPIPRNRRIVDLSARLIDGAYRISYSIDSTPVRTDSYNLDAQMPGGEKIALTLSNHSMGAIEVLWDESAFVDIGGTSKRIIHSGVALADRGRPQPNTIIPPGARIEEAILPSENIRRIDGRWVELPFFPTLLGIDKSPRDLEQYVGAEVKLFLNLKTERGKESALVTFRVQSITSSP